jgi:hypothetical protein
MSTVCCDPSQLAAAPSLEQCACSSSAKLPREAPHHLSTITPSFFNFELSRFTARISPRQHTNSRFPPSTRQLSSLENQLPYHASRSAVLDRHCICNAPALHIILSLLLTKPAGPNACVRSCTTIRISTLCHNQEKKIPYLMLMQSWAERST